MTAPTVEKRALAAFLGFAVGDALGATVEFMTKGEIAARYGVHDAIIGGGWLRLAPGKVTDDTEMSLALGRSLVRSGGLDARDVCEEFAAWLKAGPIDVGHTCRRGIRRYITQGTTEGAFFEGDAGNGAAMRTLPIALATLGRPDEAESWSLAQGRITHHHPLSDDACMALVVMLHSLLSGQDKQVARDIADGLIKKHGAFRFEPYWRPVLGLYRRYHANRAAFLFLHGFICRLRHSNRQSGWRRRYHRSVGGHARRRHLRSRRHPCGLARAARSRRDRRDLRAGAAVACHCRACRGPHTRPSYIDKYIAAFATPRGSNRLPRGEIRPPVAYCRRGVKFAWNDRDDA